jgi:Leucine-rich repeat (LRR) protein
MSVQEEWTMEQRPVDEVLTTTSGAFNSHNNNNHFEDSSSTLTPNTWEDDPDFVETDLLVVTDVVRLPLDYVVNDDLLEGIATRIVPGELPVFGLPTRKKPPSQQHLWRRASVSISFGVTLLMAIVSMTPSLCSRIGEITGDANSHSFCLATVVGPASPSNNKSATPEEVKLLDFVNSISLAGNVDPSIVEAILRRGDLELPWDADRIRQRYAVGTLLGASFVARHDECDIRANNDGGDDDDDSNPPATVTIVCDEEDMVTELRLSGAKLKGTIPQDIGLLSNRLRVLDIKDNQFSGTLPSRTLSVLTKLAHLDVSHNLLSGTIPDLLGSLKQLTHLSLADNSFSGPAPDSLCNLTRLQVLRLTQNQLSGTFPQCKWDDLEAVFINGNLFSGPLSKTIPKWTNLKQLDFSVNAFTGSIPRALSALTSLELFAVADNKLDGSFSTLVQHWPKDIQTLDVSGNNLSGSIPTEVCHWTRLQKFRTSKTNISGTLPSCIGSWTNLQDFDINQTSIGGTLPTEIGQWINLKGFSVAKTSISGTIPHQISQWISIEQARFDGTSLFGVMPLCSSLSRFSRHRQARKLGADCERVACPCCKACS